MTTLILIITLLGFPPAITQMDFKSAIACQKAGQDIYASFKNARKADGARLMWVCVER